MVPRLSGAQITRIKESLARYKESFIPQHQAIEELVNDILKEVLPSCPNQSEHQTQKEQQNVNT